MKRGHPSGVYVPAGGDPVDLSVFCIEPGRWIESFSDTELLARYWMKLVRSYAAEGLAPARERKTATVADTQQFLDTASHGRETSEGEVAVYRYREVKADGTDSFTLESLLPGTDYDVHMSKLRVKDHVLIRAGAN